MTLSPHPQKVLIRRLPHGADLPLPAYATPGSAGMDLCAAIAETWLLEPGARRLIPTGLAIALPPGYEAQVRSRSGLAVKQGVVVLNSPGTVDADYRGELQVPLINHGSEPFWIEPGLRMAQLVIAPVEQIIWALVDVLPQDTVRGQDGFGSTGLR